MAQTATLAPIQAHEDLLAPAPNTGIPHLTPHDISDILRWDAQGFSQDQIAAKFNPPRHQSTISRVLSQYGGDSRAEAKRILYAGAAPAAIDVLRKGEARDLVKVLEGIEVLANQDTKGGLTIVVGGNAQVQVNVGTSLDVGLSPVSVSDVGESVQKR